MFSILFSVWFNITKFTISDMLKEQVAAGEQQIRTLKNEVSGQCHYVLFYHIKILAIVSYRPYK